MGNMHGRKTVIGKIYPKYQPYPLTFDSEEATYSTQTPDDSEPQRGKPENFTSLEDFHGLGGEPLPSDWFATKPLPSNDENRLRPLHLLNSLFADRLDFLQRALDELESAKSDREKILQNALDELDSEIRRCELSISTLLDMFNHTGQKRHLQRILLELKRERRRETLLSWADLMQLKSEIRKLQREIDALNKTAKSAENRDTPL
jgi:hypothetical protein